MDTYTLKLPQFEGPFDLLLFFIERDELDIYDIPIAKITDDFLDYLHQMESLNIDLASEFILVAATLMRIKARLLLPRKAVDAEGNEIDPRLELVDRLLEYKQYKSVLDDLRVLEEDRQFRLDRGNSSRELREIAVKALVDAELESLNLFKLLKTFEGVLRRYEEEVNKPKPTIYTYSHTITGQQEYIISVLHQQPKVDFKSLFGEMESRIHAIITFLALLELLNLQQVKILQGEGVNHFWVSLVATKG